MQIIIGLILFLSVFGFYLWLLHSYVEDAKRTNRQNPVKSSVQPPKMGSRKMRKILNEFGEVLVKHRSLGGDSLERPCSELLVSLIVLEKALSKTEANRAKIAMIEATHIDNLRKLTEALGEDHYISIVRSPEFWVDVEDQKDLVRKAVETMKERIADSVRQVYSDRTFESKVNLETIIGNDSPQVKDFYKKNKNSN